MHNQSDFGYAIPAVGGEVKWSRDYWGAYERGDLRTALNIAYEHQHDFDWEGEQPEHWSEDARERGIELGILSGPL